MAHVQSKQALTKLRSGPTAVGREPLGSEQKLTGLVGVIISNSHIQSIASASQSDLPQI